MEQVGNHLYVIAAQRKTVNQKVTSGAATH